MKFMQSAKKLLESTNEEVIKVQEARAARETELSEGLANLQHLRTEATSAARVPPVGVCGVADATEEIRMLKAQSRSTETSRQVMRQKEAKKLSVPSPADMECTQLVSREDVPVPKDPSTWMSKWINEADSALRSARQPMA